ncbi:unnamed protein product [Lymnaea stagnalis]|uniref:BPTI/Kunitz inhibitor domain-containing protein n=1 Tax=Lymnaea stagnalis TaxID=6523 RepID=A0AAV2HHT8_LYMST
MITKIVLFCLIGLTCGSFLNRAVCSFQKDTGPCRASFPKYYYNLNTKNCQPFIYGGCSGNANRFNTVDKCMAACSM